MAIPRYIRIIFHQCTKHTCQPNIMINLTAISFYTTCPSQHKIDCTNVAPAPFTYIIRPIFAAHHFINIGIFWVKHIVGRSIRIACTDIAVHAIGISLQISRRRKKDFLCNTRFRKTIHKPVITTCHQSCACETARSQ